MTTAEAANVIAHILNDIPLVMADNAKAREAMRVMVECAERDAAAQAKAVELDGGT